MTSQMLSNLQERYNFNSQGREILLGDVVHNIDFVDVPADGAIDRRPEQVFRIERKARHTLRHLMTDIAFQLELIK